MVERVACEGKGGGVGGKGKGGEGEVEVEVEGEGKGGGGVCGACMHVLACVHVWRACICGVRA